MEAYLPIGFLLIFAIAISLGIFTLSSLIGPRKTSANDEIKLAPYECGIRSEDNARQPFKNRFYIIAVLFLLFDVEAAFFFPWALVYRDSIAAGPELLIAMLAYMFLLVLGLVYIFRKKVLELT